MQSNQKVVFSSIFFIFIFVCLAILIYLAAKNEQEKIKKYNEETEALRAKYYSEIEDARKEIGSFESSFNNVVQLTPENAMYIFASRNDKFLMYEDYKVKRRLLEFVNTVNTKYIFVKSVIQLKLGESSISPRDVFELKYLHKEMGVSFINLYMFDEDIEYENRNYAIFPLWSSQYQMMVYHTPDDHEPVNLHIVGVVELAKFGGNYKSRFPSGSTPLEIFYETTINPRPNLYEIVVNPISFQVYQGGNLTHEAQLPYEREEIFCSKGLCIE